MRLLAAKGSEIRLGKSQNSFQTLLSQTFELIEQEREREDHFNHSQLCTKHRSLDVSAVVKIASYSSNVLDFRGCVLINIDLVNQTEGTIFKNTVKKVKHSPYLCSFQNLKDQTPSIEIYLYASILRIMRIKSIYSACFSLKKKPSK